MSKTTIELLDRVSAALGDASDYRIAKMLSVTRGTVSNWRVGRTGMGDATAVQVAEILGENPALIIARLHEESADTPAVKRVYKQIAASFGGKAAAVLAATLLVSGHATKAGASIIDQQARTAGQCILW